MSTTSPLALLWWFYRLLCIAFGYRANCKYPSCFRTRHSMARAKVERDKDKVQPMFDFTDFLAFMAIEDAHEEHEKEERERDNFWNSEDNNDNDSSDW